MTREEQLNYLIQKLIDEEPQYDDIVIPNSLNDKKHLLRSLMNVRPPKPVSSEFLNIQDEFLKSELKDKGITDADMLRPSSFNSRIFLWKGDITTLKTDAIVNAANSRMLGCFVPCHGCIDNAIHSASGIQLRLECDKLMKIQGYEEPAGCAKITKAYNLPCRYVIHTVGPIVYERLTQDNCRLLKNCYLSCLKLAAENDIKSIAFCCISTGEFHFPHEKAAEIAVDTAAEFLNTNKQIKKVIFNVFKEEDYTIYQKLLR